MTNPLNQLGTIRKFNGVNVEQTRGSSRWFYAPIMPCVTRRTDAQGLTRPYNARYAVKYLFFAQILTPIGAQTTLIY
jgi:hypothetical protein